MQEPNTLPLSLLSLPLSPLSLIFKMAIESFYGKFIHSKWMVYYFRIAVAR